MSQSLPCGITVTGEVHAQAQLSAKFQIKAREFGLTDSESLAVWIEGDIQKIQAYFQSRYGDFYRALESGKTKLQLSPKTWDV